MRRALPLLLLLTLACSTASSQRPSTIAQPDLDARLVTQLYFGSGTEAPATIEVGVRNRAQVPIVVRRIQITAPGMRQYTLVPTTRTFRETVQPGETKVLTLFTTAIANTTRNPDEPLLLRAIVELEGGGNKWREVLMKRGA